MKNVCFLALVGFITVFWASSALAQPTLTVGNWVPPLTLTNITPLNLEYQVGGTTNICEVTWVRQDGATVSVANIDPTSAQPFNIDLPLGPAGDRVQVTWIGTIRDTLTNQTAGGDRAATIIFDNVGPDQPNITSPALPHTSYSPTFTINGNVSNNPPAGGNTDTAETGGAVIIYDPANNNNVIGGGIVQSDSTFIASVDMSSLTSGTVHNLSIHAVDPAGNLGTTGTIQLGYTVPPPPTLTNLTITPPDGTITNNPGVTVSGTVDGTVGPFTVNIFVDGLIQSQIAGLAAGESFNHTLTLPGEGSHAITIQAVNSNTPPDFSVAQSLGTITLDRTPPGAPLITVPSPNVSPFITNANSFEIQGISQERDSNTTDTITPAILLSGPSGVTFNPTSPLAIAANGQFNTEAAIQNLDDGTYTITLTTRDEAGNTGPESETQIIFVRDTTAPLAEEIRVDGVVAPQTNPEIYVGQRSVRVRIRVNEDMPTAPSASVEQSGNSTQAMGLSSSTLRIFDYVHGVIPGYDGPVNVTFTGGADRAGNRINQTFSRLFIVDTVPPTVESVLPTEGTSVAQSPERIRIRFNDPLSGSNTASGVDLTACEVEVRGPTPGANGVIAGTLVPYDPVTLDFIPSNDLPGEGTYRVTITAVDKVGNRSGQIVRSFIFDTSPIRLTEANVFTNPPDGAFVNATTMPGTAANPFVEATITDPQFDAAHSTILVRDYCRVPPTVPGTQTTTGPTNLTYTFSNPLRTDGGHDGVYTIEMDIRDFAGNLAPTYITTFTYDTRPPSVKHTFPSTDETVRGPLRIVDATMQDSRVDFCRQNAGIDRNVSTLELWLMEPNQYSGNTEAAPYQIPGTLRFVSVGDVERVLLEIVNNQGVVTGLATDGSDDGKYEIRTEAFDRAGNRSGITTINFTYDTQVPVLDLVNIQDGCVFTPNTVEFTGTTQDNRGGSGIDKVLVTLQEVDDLNLPTAAVPIFKDLAASLVPLGLGPFDPNPPERQFAFSGDISQVTTTVKAALVVRSYDKGGNFAERRHIVTVRPSTLPPPVLSTPADGATTASRFVKFTWSKVAGAAGYRVRIVTPNHNEVIKEVGRDVEQLTINLESYSDGDGRYTWAVASRDCSSRYGDYSRSRILYVDHDRPRVVAIDIFDPSPESTGSINEGEVRFTIRFSEQMDTSRDLEVTIHPETLNLPVLNVEKMSYIADTWTGRAFIPDVTVNEPDYNGLATISVKNGVDLSSNPMIEPNEGFTVFEIDTGPFFEIALFQNPVNMEDIILLVKGTTKVEGPAERLIEPVTVLVKRAGQADQMPQMFRLANLSQAFRGSFFLDNQFASDLEFQISGSDDQGNTSTRYINLEVSRITSREGGIVINQNRSMILSAGPGAVKEDQNLFLSARSAALTDAAEQKELELLAPLGAVEPQGVNLPGGVDLLVNLNKVAQGLNSGQTSKAGIYRLEGTKWVYLPGAAQDGTLTGRMEKTGTLAILADNAPPRLEGITEEGIKLSSAGQPVELKVVDGGSGVNPSSISVTVDGQEQSVQWDEDTGVATFTPKTSLREGNHPVTVKAADLVGNLAEAATFLVAPPAFGFREAVAYPNPARVVSRIRYRLNQDADRVTATIYDVAGHKVCSLEGATSAAAPQVITWDLMNRRGRAVANGVYIVRLKAHGQGVSQREDIRVAVLR